MGTSCPLWAGLQAKAWARRAPTFERVAAVARRHDTAVRVAFGQRSPVELLEEVLSRRDRLDGIPEPWPRFRISSVRVRRGRSCARECANWSPWCSRFPMATRRPAGAALSAAHLFEIQSPAAQPFAGHPGRVQVGGPGGLA